MIILHVVNIDFETIFISFKFISFKLSIFYYLLFIKYIYINFSNILYKFQYIESYK